MDNEKNKDGKMKANNQVYLHCRWMHRMSDGNVFAAEVWAIYIKQQDANLITK